jgi:ERCC4-related helicase
MLSLLFKNKNTIIKIAMGIDNTFIAAEQLQGRLYMIVFNEKGNIIAPTIDLVEQKLPAMQNCAEKCDNICLYY